MQRKKHLAGLALAAIVVSGAGVSPAAAGTRTTTAAVQFAVQSPVQFPVAAAPSALAAATSPAAPAATATGEQAGAVFRAIVAAIQRVPGLWSRTVAAVRAGWTAFRNFWNNSVPGWIKALLWGWSLYDLYIWLRGIV